MDLDSRAKVIGTSPMFAGLNEARLSRLAATASVRRYPKGRSVFLQGDPADFLFFVISGRLKIVATSEDGQEMVLATVGPNETFGELAIADGGPRSASVHALTESMLLRLPLGEVSRCSEEAPEILHVMLTSLATVVRRLTGTAADLVFLDLPRRVAKYLLKQAEVRGADRVELELTQGELAQHLGSSRQSLNATLKALDRRGWIHVRGHQVEISDAAALRRFVGE